MESKLNVIILAGGSGKRLRPLTFAIPKPLIPVGEKPILELLLRRLGRAGLKRIFLAVGYRAELIETYFGNGKRFGLRLRYKRESSPLGTAGPVRLLRDSYKLKGACLVLNADILTDIDFRHLIRWHKKEHADMTVVSSKYAYKVPFGILGLKGRLVERVEEKPVLRFDISTGIYVLEQAAIDLIPRRQAFHMTDLMPSLIKAKKRLLAYPLKAKWSAIETISDLANFYGKQPTGMPI